MTVRIPRELAVHGTAQLMFWLSFTPEKEPSPWVQRPFVPHGLSGVRSLQGTATDATAEAPWPFSVVPLTLISSFTHGAATTCKSALVGGDCPDSTPQEAARPPKAFWKNPLIAAVAGYGLEFTTLRSPLCVA